MRLRLEQLDEVRRGSTEHTRSINKSCSANTSSFVNIKYTQLEHYFSFFSVLGSKREQGKRGGKIVSMTAEAFPNVYRTFMKKSHLILG